MTGKKQIWKILKKSISDVDIIHNNLIDYMDTTTKEFECLSNMISNVRQNLSFLESSLSCEIRMINEKSKLEKQWKSASSKVGNLKLNFLDFLTKRIDKQNKIIQAQKDYWNI